MGKPKEIGPAVTDTIFGNGTDVPGDFIGTAVNCTDAPQELQNGVANDAQPPSPAPAVANPPRPIPSNVQQPQGVSVDVDAATANVQVALAQRALEDSRSREQHLIRQIGDMSQAWEKDNKDARKGETALRREINTLRSHHARQMRALDSDKLPLEVSTERSSQVQTELTTLSTNV